MKLTPSCPLFHIFLYFHHFHIFTFSLDFDSSATSWSLVEHLLLDCSFYLVSTGKKEEVTTLGAASVVSVSVSVSFHKSMSGFICFVSFYYKNQINFINFINQNSPWELSFVISSLLSLSLIRFQSLVYNLLLLTTCYPIRLGLHSLRSSPL